MTRDGTNKLPENLARQVLARAAELDASDRVSVSIPDLRSAAVEAGISERALDQALSEVDAMQAVSIEAAQETKARFKGRFIAAVAVIVLLVAFIGTMTVFIPRSVVVSSEEAPAPGAFPIFIPPVPPVPPVPPPPPPPLPGSR